ncbi:hypothetical protein GOBAR_DD27949 [Gossypium barbadense]|nr:hypothetical protein GOBAR_DD27949 [Gossypium barbadense]
MVMKGWMVVEKGRRIVRTAFFMVAMLTSLLASSLPLLAAIGDIMIPSLLLSSFTCVTCYGLKEHFRRYAFKYSLTDIPLVSILRSIIIICVYSMCDGPALSHGPYLGTVALCSFVSILVLSVKACVFTVNSQIVADASSGYSLARQRLHFKKSWGMPVLFLSSVVFALGHIVVAYRTCCRARRKLLFHRVDPEAVSFMGQFHIWGLGFSLISTVVLLSVSLSREVVPAFARILLRTSLGKKHLVRPLLRTEITQVVNRRAWYDAPLCVEGWDEALHEIGRLSNETILSPQNATSLLKAVEEMPVLVITGAEDAHISLKSSQAMASKLVNSRLVAISGCGHLPHEECPKALLAAISPFLSRLLLKPELHWR